MTSTTGHFFANQKEAQVQIYSLVTAPHKAKSSPFKDKIFLVVYDNIFVSHYIRIVFIL